MDSNYWLIMIIELMLIPGIMIGFGWSFMKKAPKSMNAAFSYRSARATKSREAWEFAHHYIGKIWFYLGIVTAVVTAIAMLIVARRSPEVISMMAGTVIMLHLIPFAAAMIPTELALKKNFDEEGNRK